MCVVYFSILLSYFGLFLLLIEDTVMGCGTAEATGLGFVCFVVINPRVLSADLGYFCFTNNPKFTELILGFFSFFLIYPQSSTLLVTGLALESAVWDNIASRIDGDRSPSMANARSEDFRAICLGKLGNNQYRYFPGLNLTLYTPGLPP